MVSTAKCSLQDNIGDYPDIISDYSKVGIRSFPLLQNIQPQRVGLKNCNDWVHSTQRAGSGIINGLNANSSWESHLELKGKEINHVTTWMHCHQSFQVRNTWLPDNWMRPRLAAAYPNGFSEELHTYTLFSTSEKKLVATCFGKKYS